MVNPYDNILHNRYRIELDRLDAYGEHIDDIVKSNMSRQIAEMIVERALIKAHKDFAEQYMEYAMDCAVITPERYMQLLRAEKKLQSYKEFFLDDE